MTTPPYRDTPAVPMRLAAGHMFLCQEQSLESAIDTEKRAQAELLMAQDPTTWLPYVLRPVYGWQLVQCGLQ